MTYFDDMFKNRKLLINTFASLVKNEGDRIVRSGVATKKDLNTVLNDVVKKQANSSNSSNEVLINILSNLYSKLKTVKFASDFEELKDEPFHDLSGIKTTYKGEPFYELPKPAGEEDKIKEEILEEQDEPEREEEIEEYKEKLSNIITNYLSKIAYNCGRQGQHRAAYIIERNIKKLRG